MSMPENTCPTPEADETRFTLSIISPDGSELYQLPISLPKRVENMLLNDLMPSEGAIWKHSAPLSAIGTASTAPSQLCLLLFCHPKASRGTDG
jgi:hypothetical protein